LSPLAKAAVTNLKLLHPEWEYHRFDDNGINSFLVKEFPQYQTILGKLRYHIQRYDFFRYLAVYRLGGFYFDLDVFLSRPLNDLLSHESVFPFEELTLNRFLRKRCNMDWQLGNYAFGAASGNAFLAAIIENCIRAQSDQSWLRPMMQDIRSLRRAEFYVYNSTGPALVSRTFAERPELATGVKVLFPDDVCDQRNWHLFGDYGVHVMSGSWVARGNSLTRRIANRLDALSHARFLRGSRRLGPRRSSVRASAKLSKQPCPINEQGSGRPDLPGTGTEPAS